ncbi:MAG: universal stress protein [Acidimicrobiales bacterium]
MSEQSGKRIVVGIDGSDGASTALLWAAEEARLRGAKLEVVHAWHPVAYAYPEAYMVNMPDLETAAKEMVTKTLEAHAHALQGIEVVSTVLEGHAGKAIVDAAEGAEMMVVGSRGRSGVASLLLGSVSTFCVHHAPGVVVVVPAGE